MKKQLLFLGLLAAALILASCSLDVQRDDEQAEIDKAVAEAEAKTQKGVELFALGGLEGDLRPFTDYMDEEGFDVPKGLAVGKPAAKSPETAEELESDLVCPHFGHGDVILFRGAANTWQNQLISWIATDITFYHHAVVFDETRYDGHADTPCFLSATLDIGPDGLVNGLWYQTWEALYSTSAVITHLTYQDGVKSGTDVSAGIGIVDGIYANQATAYAFLHLNLEPVDRWDDYWWYCSKVPWRVYALAPQKTWWGRITGCKGVSIEDADYYETEFPGTEVQLWEAFRDSPLYKLYCAALDKALPGWLKRRYPNLVGDLADAKIQRVMRELVMPDELRAFDGVSSKDFLVSDEAEPPQLDWD